MVSNHILFSVDRNILSVAFFSSPKKCPSNLRKVAALSVLIPAISFFIRQTSHLIQGRLD